GSPGPLSVTVIPDMSAATRREGAMSASSQASRALSSNSLTMTRGHSSRPWPVWVTSSFSEKKSITQLVLNVTRSSRLPAAAGAPLRASSIFDMLVLSVRMGSLVLAGRRALMTPPAVSISLRVAPAGGAAAALGGLQLCGVEQPEFERPERGLDQAAQP